MPPSRLVARRRRPSMVAILQRKARAGAKFTLSPPVTMLSTMAMLDRVTDATN
jgi:hypothetical protein